MDCKDQVIHELTDSIFELVAELVNVAIKNHESVSVTPKAIHSALHAQVIKTLDNEIYINKRGNEND